VVLDGPLLRGYDHVRLTVCALLATPVLPRTSQHSDLVVSFAQLWIGQEYGLHYRPLQLLRSEPICH
jgi:hypothetical protein